jgi:glycosyltransferase involved in cell wall biosynthesis
MLTPRVLQVESWRAIPHSYSIVNQFQLLEFLKEPNLTLRHREIPFVNPQWKRIAGLFSPEAERAIAGISPPVAGEVPDAILRITFPYHVSPSHARRTVVFGTAEHRCVPDYYLTGKRSLAEACRQCDAILVTPSNWSRLGFIHSGAPEHRVKVVPHGVDVSLFHPLELPQRQQLRTQLKWSGFVFLSLGSMTLNKGVALLLKAFAAVAQKHPQVRLMTKGLSALYTSTPMLQSQVAQLTQAELAIVQPRLMYTDQTLPFAGMAQLYQAADAYVAPYSAEGFNLPVLEAIACGLPVICTAGGSTDDFVTSDFALPIQSTLVQFSAGPDSSDGFELKPDFDHLVHQMLTAVESPQLAANARITGPAFVARGFTWQQVCQRLLAIFFDQPG